MHLQDLREQVPRICSICWGFHKLTLHSHSHKVGTTANEVRYELIIWCIKLTILSCILSVGDWKQLTNRTSTSLPTSTQKMSISQLLFFFNIFVTWALFFFQANNICYLFFQYKLKKLATKHEQLTQKRFWNVLKKKC